ncbi:hypothetical protein GGE07_000004 [Sinorhizobium terangae]|nr:hypothetical protein [Sinorhizobium terangae]
MVRYVALAQRKRVDALVRLPCLQAMFEIVGDAGGGLVTVLGGLGEELHHDRSNRSRNALRSLVRRHRLAGDMAMDPFHRIRGRERKRPGQHLVQRDTERVEIAARINGAVHATSLLGRHIGKRPRDDLRGFWRPPFTRHARSNAEA